MTATGKERLLKADTKYFGQVTYDVEDVLTFPKGLFGFEEEKKFLLLPFSGGGSLFCLQSLATPGLAFVAMDPFTLHAGYAPVPEKEDLEEMGVTTGEELYYYALCAVKNPVAESTVNLKCPIAINGETRRAMQVILGTGSYQMRHRLSEFGRGEADAPC